MEFDSPDRSSSRDNRSYSAVIFEYLAIISTTFLPLGFYFWSFRFIVLLECTPRERVVTIPLGIWELLMALRQQQVLHSGVPDREQPIFTDPDGHVPHPDSFTRHLRKLYKQCGLSEEYHLHTLRHFYATYLLQEGTSKQVTASLLGHADTAFLERTYCHPQDVAKQQAAKLMQDLLNKQNPCYVAFMKNKNRKAKKAG
ncbi:tyrosine-type recombinase/integrase [Gemmiger formicilis]|uniref:tyrosine-type recombinase/integrase n=1 Tax=Gemmiger formicilis TaxID=745368 RepID=UPI002109CDA3|nr:site-specific integrase [Gemmiger formicilis]MCQ5079410.1 tyrosine-type recombinase/integrase [Gemmiger formicilis]MCQ5116059.1 tyrosine-type recombinase/integrase [Gemmiger formicilis]